VEPEQGIGITVSEKNCARNNADNNWHLEGHQIVAPAMSAHTKAMCIGVQDGSCEPGASVELKPCDEMTPDLEWNAKVTSGGSGCGPGDPERPSMDAPKGDCTLELYHGYNYKTYVSSYGIGKYFTRKMTASIGWKDAKFAESMKRFQQGIRDGDYSQEDIKGFTGEGSSGPGDSDWTLLEENATSSAESLVKKRALRSGRSLIEKVRRTEGVYSDKDRHTTSINSFKLYGPVGCEAILYEDEKLEGMARCDWTVEGNDEYGAQEKDEIAACPDTALCCGLNGGSGVDGALTAGAHMGDGYIASFEVKWNAMAAKAAMEKEQQAAR
jgi:hypothetical protein